MVYTVLVVLGCLRNPLVILQKTSSFWWKSESLCFDYAQQPWQKILNHHMLWMCSHALHVLQVRIPTQQRHSDENQNLFVSTTLNNRDKRSWTKFSMTFFFANLVILAKETSFFTCCACVGKSESNWEKTSPDSK